MKIISIFRGDAVGKSIRVKGWVIKRRKHGNIIFIDLRLFDKPWQPLQIVVKREEIHEDLWDQVKGVTQESSLIIEGNIVENPRAPGGIELHAKNIEITHIAKSPYPLGKKSHSPEILMQWRHLSVRSTRYTKIWIVRDYLLGLAREYFKTNNWFEVSPPIIVSTAVEGGATLFEIKYFDNSKAYLSQSAQLYLEVMMFSLGRVWSLTPSFRAEKSRTRRHLAEYWHLEAEAAWYRFEDNLRVQEELISYILKGLLDNDVTQEIIKEFRGDIERLEEIKPPFKRISYDEAIDILQSNRINIKWGDDIGVDEEKILSREIDEPFFLTHFPSHLKAFYVKLDPKRPEICLAADLLAPEGYGEIIGGSEREDKIDILVERIKNEGFDPGNYSWYLDLRRYGSVPHSGFGLGVERLLWWIMKLDHIRDTIPFPRLARVKKFI